MVRKMMFRTKDNCIAVMDMPYADGVLLNAKIREYEIYFAQHDYSEPLSGSYAADFDKKNTEFVNSQIHGFSYKRQPDKYVNHLNIPARDADFLPGISYVIKDDEVPQDVKSLGYEIKPRDIKWEIKLVGDEYKLYNKADGSLVDEDNLPSLASVIADKKCITITKRHYDMDSATKNLMQTLCDDFQRSGKSAAEFAVTLSDKEKSLFKIYDRELQWNKKLLLSFHHECKHGKNGMFLDTNYFNKADKRVSANDTMRLVIEDEISASMSELVNDINEYFKHKEWDNLDYFKSYKNNWLIIKLQTMPMDMRKDFLKNPNNYVEEARQEWLKNFQKDYDLNQFGPHSSGGRNYDGSVIDFVNKTPMNLSEDAKDLSDTYKKIRKMMYHFALYDPDSNKYKQVYLDKYIDDSEDILSDYERDNIIPKAQEQLNKKKQKYDEDITNGADFSLIEQARRFMRQNKLSTEYVHPENIYIESLDADYIAAHGIESENADWSNYLQSYYQRLPDYTEIAKNDEEYVFKLGQDIVRYTDKNTLALSKQSKFETYMNILAEPSNKNSAVNFLPGLDKEQALMLYAACVANGRKMKGNVPTDLNGLNHLQGIPPHAMDLINRHLGRTTTATPTATASRLSYPLRGRSGGR